MAAVGNFPMVAQHMLHDAHDSVGRVWATLPSFSQSVATTSFVCDNFKKAYARDPHRHTEAQQGEGGQMTLNLEEITHV